MGIFSFINRWHQLDNCISWNQNLFDSIKDQLKCQPCGFETLCEFIFSNL